METITINKLEKEIYHEKLDNGLNIYMLKNDKVDNYYITLTCRYGAIDNEFEVDNKKIKVPYGIAHFLEHVNFNEGENITAHDFFTRLGTFYNAFTTFDFTTYEVMSSTFFEENLSHLINYVSNYYLTDELVEKEKNIICEEIKMGKNNPGNKLFFGSKKALLNNDKRKFLITGEIKDVTSITRSDLKLVFDYYYHPENMFFVITGNFDLSEALNIIKREYGKLNFKKWKSPISIRTKETMSIPKTSDIISANIEVPKTKISFKMERDLFDEFDDDTLQIYIDSILHNNFGSTSLFKEQLMETNLISFISASCDVSHDLIIISIVYESKSKDKEKICDLIIDNLSKMSITDDDIIRYGRINIASLINSYDDIEYVNSDIIDQLIRNKKINDNYFDLFNDLSSKKANQVLKKLDFSKKSIIYMVPKKENR